MQILSSETNHTFKVLPGQALSCLYKAETLLSKWFQWTGRCQRYNDIRWRKPAGASWWGAERSNPSQPTTHGNPLKRHRRVEKMLQYVHPLNLACDKKTEFICTLPSFIWYTKSVSILSIIIYSHFNTSLIRSVYTLAGAKFMFLENFTKHPSLSMADHISRSVFFCQISPAFCIYKIVMPSEDGNWTGAWQNSMLGFQGDRVCERNHTCSLSETQETQLLLYQCINVDVKCRCHNPIHRSTPNLQHLLLYPQVFGHVSAVWRRSRVIFTAGCTKKPMNPELRKQRGSGNRHLEK